MSLRSMSHVEFKKSPCRSVEFKGQGPRWRDWEEVGVRWEMFWEGVSEGGCPPGECFEDIADRRKVIGGRITDKSASFCDLSHVTLTMTSRCAT